MSVSDGASPRPSLRVHGHSKLAFGATTVALVVLASSGTGLLVNHLTKSLNDAPGALPAGTGPDSGTMQRDIIVDRAPGSLGVLAPRAAGAPETGSAQALLDGLSRRAPALISTQLAAIRSGGTSLLVGGAGVLALGPSVPVVGPIVTVGVPVPPVVVPPVDIPPVVEPPVVEPVVVVPVVDPTVPVAAITTGSDGKKAPKPAKASNATSKSNGKKHGDPNRGADGRGKHRDEHGNKAAHQDADSHRRNHGPDDDNGKHNAKSSGKHTAKPSGKHDSKASGKHTAKPSGKHAKK